MADTVGGGFPTSGVQKGSTFFDIDDSTTWIYLGGPPRLVSSWKLLNGIFTTNPDTTLWGQPQRGAIWWNSSEGKLQTWNGTSIQDLIVYPMFYRYPTNIDLQDDFVTGATTQGTIGVYSWFSSGGTSTLLNVSNSSGRPGVLQRITGAVANTVASLLLSGQQGVFPLTCVIDLLWVCRASQVDTDTVFRIGMCNTATLNPITGSAAFFEKLGPDTNWFATCYAGGVATRIDTGIAVDLGFHEFLIRVRENGTIYTFFIDNVLVGTMTVGIPVVPMQPATQVINLVGVSKTFDHDYFEMHVSNIIRSF